MAVGCLRPSEVSAVGLIELLWRTVAALPERVWTGGPPVDQPEVVDEGVTKPPFFTVEKEVGKSRDLAVDLGQSRIALEIDPAESTELSQRNEKAIFQQAFAGGRNPSCVAAAERESKRSRLQAFHVTGDRLEGPHATLLACQTICPSALSKQLVGRLMFNGSSRGLVTLKKPGCFGWCPVDAQRLGNAGLKPLQFVDILLPIGQQDGSEGGGRSWRSATGKSLLQLCRIDCEAAKSLQPDQPSLLKSPGKFCCRGQPGG